MEVAAKAVSALNWKNPAFVAQEALNDGWGHPDGWRLKHWRQTFWEWDGRQYQKIHESDVRGRLILWMSNNPGFPDEQNTPGRVRHITDAIRALTSTLSGCELNSWVGPGEAPHGDDYLLGVANGLLNISAWLRGESHVLSPHTPNWFSAVCLPVEYNPDATCPLWDRLIEEWLGDDPTKIELLDEWFGYCLDSRFQLQAAMFLYGSGANGKTVVQETLRQLLGHKNCSAVALERFGGQFDLFHSLGKLLNVCGDVLDKIKTSDEVHFKRYTGGDVMNFDQKYLPVPIEATPTAKLMCNFNAFPSIADESDGMWRRLNVLIFNRTVAEEDRDYALSQYAAPDWPLRPELPGILNRALRGLARLKETRMFTQPNESVRLLHERRHNYNELREFLKASYRPCPGGRISVASVCETVTRWSLDHGIIPSSTGEITATLKKLFPVTVAPKRPVYIGIEAIPTQGEEGSLT